MNQSTYPGMTNSTLSTDVAMKITRNSFMKQFQQILTQKPETSETLCVMNQ